MITSCISNKLRGSSRRRLRRPGQATPLNDSFEYNPRSELTGATLGTTPYSYAYDNIGNRETAQEAAQAVTNYITNLLNQYTNIAAEAQTPFTPQYDAAGNQTKVKTSTGIWTLVYDANNRPISFTSEDWQAIITCGYNYMGRRHMKKVTVGGIVQSHQFYLYRGYLQIAALDLTTSGAPALWYTHWNPTEPVATRPLSIRKNGTWYTYGHDLTKNVTELYKTDGTLEAAYDYTPFGAVSRQGSDNQPFQWSSEVYDAELGMVYYNYRHYNPLDGRWIGRDLIAEHGGWNLYGHKKNSIMNNFDLLGLDVWVENTTAVNGFHRRVCVDNWNGPFDEKPSDGERCCVDGKWYKKQGKYCISFGMNGGGGVGSSGGSSEDGGSSDSSGNSSTSGNEQVGQSKPLVPFPEGIDGPYPNGDGTVYSDNDDPATEEPYRSTTSCCQEDMAIKDYFNRLNGQSANYALCGQNCRDFSKAVFDHCVNNLKNKCK